MTNKNDNKKISMKELIFNKFYLELILFFIILFLSTIINLIIYTKVNNTKVIIALSTILLIITLGVLYYFGFIISSKRKLMNKYFPSIFFLLIFSIIWIMSAIFSGKNNFIATFFNNSNIMILYVHKYIFNCINLLFSVDIPSRIFIFITPLFVYLGNRKNRELDLLERKKVNERRYVEDGNN